MCGIIGFASSEGISKGWIKRKEFMKDGLYVDSLRGMHSTGLMMIPKHNPTNVIIHKKAMCGMDFLDLSTTDKYLNDVDKFQFCIGHNRHATKGSVSHKMAHPFQHGKITLVHNGTLLYHSNLPEGNSFISDSEAIAYALSVQSSEKIIPKLNGAFALVWHDASDDTLHIIRNDERPLYFGKVKEQDTLLIASEYQMLDWIATRNNMEIDEIYEPTVGHELIFKNQDFDKYISKEHKLYEKISNIQPGHHLAAWNGKWDDYGYGGFFDRKKDTPHWATTSEELLSQFGLTAGQKVKVEVDSFTVYNTQNGTSTGKAIGYLECSLLDEDTEHVVTVHNQKYSDWNKFIEDEITVTIKTAYTYSGIGIENGINIIANDPQMHVENNEEKKIIDLFVGPFGRTLTKTQWDEYTKHGCAMCEGNIYDEDSGKITWTSDQQPICYDCRELYNW